MKNNHALRLGPVFSRLLLDWNKTSNTRSLPWKGERDPYRIWLSEIILQQTRVEQGRAYYLRFIKAFPGIKDLANAREEEVFKLWEGLGYYSRCRNLMATAKILMEKHEGRFPRAYENILALKGIGPYTAAAISSFAFDHPLAVADGNVFRVLARVTGESRPIDSAAGKSYFTALANQLLDKKKPALHNQAIMDFGATICKPLAPLCSDCVFNKHCLAFRRGQVKELPAKRQKHSIKNRWFYYFVLESRGRLAVQRRSGKDIWLGLHEFPQIEKTKKEEPWVLIEEAKKKKWFPSSGFELCFVSPVHKQQLTHQLVAGQFLHFKLERRAKTEKEWKWLPKKHIDQLSWPRLLHHYLPLLKS